MPPANATGNPNSQAPNPKEISSANILKTVFHPERSEGSLEFEQLLIQIRDVSLSLNMTRTLHY